MNLQISDAKPLGHGLWIVNVAPEVISVLGRAPARLGTRSILVATGVTASGDGNTICFPIRETHLLNQGTTAETIVIETGGKNPMLHQDQVPMVVPAPPRARIENNLLEAIDNSNHVSGSEGNSAPTTDRGVTCPTAAPERQDSEFLEALRKLPPALAELGRQILEGVRREEPSGSLRFYPTSGRYVEKTDNFWTIKPQPRDQSFVITVRGEPDQFLSSQIELMPDRGSYSRFKVQADSEVDEAVRIILSARRKP